MSDILVTVPKKEYKIFEQELYDIRNKGMCAFWTMSRKPKDTHVGDRVYFLYKNLIQYSMEIESIYENHGSMTCETTGRVWPGRCHLVLKDLREEDMDEYIKGFQGYRYMKEE